MGLCLYLYSDKEQNNEIYDGYRDYFLSTWVYKNVDDVFKLDGLLTIEKDKISILHKQITHALNYFLKCEVGLYFNKICNEYEPVFKKVETHKLPYFCGSAISPEEKEKIFHWGDGIIEHNVYLEVVNQLHRTKKAIESCLKYDKIYYREC